MTDDMQKMIFSENLKRLLAESGRTQKELADGIGVSPQLVNTWVRAKNIPRMGKIEKIADFFRVKKSDLIDEVVFEARISVLSDDERILIEKYRGADKNTRDMVDRALDYYYMITGRSDSNDD